MDGKLIGYTTVKDLDLGSKLHHKNDVYTVIKRSHVSLIVVKDCAFWL